ncbi:MAG TPA: hypothetical protein VNP04_13615 [Alphaproteobacteria bacterium]|nr:hypothetical protein [Alphaproteobacteria bacterium]
MAFYGMSWSDTVHMPVSWFLKLYNRIQVVEARRLLSQLNVVAYPHLEESGRERVHESLMRLAGYERMQQEALAQDRYEASWDILRSFGRPAKKSP